MILNVLHPADVNVQRAASGHAHIGPAALDALHQAHARHIGLPQRRTQRLNAKQDKLRSKVLFKAPHL